MTRNIFEGMKVHEEEDDKIKEYTPPDEKVVDIELVNRLVNRLADYYLSEIDTVMLSISEFEASKLESLIEEDIPNNFTSQVVIDSLIKRFAEDEPDSKFFYRGTEYLTALIQALYNRGYGSEFVVDIREWPEGDSSFTTISSGEIGAYFSIGEFLKARPGKPLTLTLYGDFIRCCFWAEHCNLNLHGNAQFCGLEAENCNFILYDYVEHCGPDAEQCTFDLMPGAKVRLYHGRKSKGTKRRYLNHRGEVNKIRTFLSNLRRFPS